MACNHANSTGGSGRCGGTIHWPLVAQCLSDRVLDRFLIEMDGDGSVWYDILAFSRPNHVLARIGYPYVRRVQKRFGQHSAVAMQQAVESALVIETTG
jgi:hypothetical protein